MKPWAIFLSLLLLAGIAFAQEPAALPMVRGIVTKEYPELFKLYQDLHAHPELSLHEETTSQRIAAELRKIENIQVTEKVGGFGVVGVLKNGNGPTVLVRCDLDALPVKEQTGLPYASSVMTKDDSGKDVPVMHACGHDVHMTSLVGTARTLTQLKEQWSGTIVFIAQPAEERVGGAKLMLADGLFTRFPKPDFCLALHDAADLPAGTIGYNEGFVLANVDSVDITVRGVGGHGAYPHTTKDPIVLASEIVVALQTIVSREIQPGEPAVVTIGSIHGGTKHNIIPDEVKLQLTLRSYTDEVRQQTMAAVKRIVRGQALSAGVPEDRLPEVKFSEDSTPSTYNEPKLTRRLAPAWESWLGKTNVNLSKPTMGAEDFSQYGRTPEKIPSCIFWVGGVEPRLVSESPRQESRCPHCIRRPGLPSLSRPSKLRSPPCARLSWS
ncbi:MAG: peptidase [Verrucomicrobiales bacterium]|nr:peptidase [Verrucomicrobiales bacterium]